MPSKNHKIAVYICQFLIVFTFFLPVVNAKSGNNLNTGGKDKLKKRIIENISGETIEKAGKILLEIPVTVTSATCKRSAGGKHDFYSEGDYWWPDPANQGGPYIQKDGQTNPENFSEHRLAMIRLSELTATLTSAWLLTGDQKYAQSAVKHLNAWFVDTATMMNPNMLYAQAIWGRFTGRGIGLIDAYHLVEVARSIQVLTEGKAIPAKDAAKIKAWFSTFLTWMTTHQYGIDEMSAKNNHGTCWAVTAAAMARLTGNQQVLDLCSERFKTIFLPSQMADDGSFPLELKRTKPYGYSLFNIDAMCNLAQILSTPENNLWEFSTPDGKSLKKGMEYIFPFITDKSKWPFAKDIYIWDEWPVRQSSLLFAGMAFQDEKYINTFLSLPSNPTHPEVIRNLPVRHPLIWLDFSGPISAKMYKNPIIPGFNPDPSVCRVGNYYYLVTSSFEYFPGVPVYRSRDLVNWKMVGHCLSRPSQLNLDSVACSGGIYAPTIRYHKGTFYMITTLMGKKSGNRGNFVVTAKNPAGPWSEPYWIENAPGIDPSLFFDDDGKAWYHGNYTPEKPVWDKHRNIWVQELDLKTWKLVGPRYDILDGSEYYKKGTLNGGVENGVNNYEAPHIYKKNGWYYLLIAHGGTSQNHAVSIWRSQKITGPYEMNPANPILTHRDLSKEHSITSTGHLDFVETQNSEWWAVYLAKRPLGGENHILGRETFLSPVDWKGEWPVVNPNGKKGRGETVHFKPNLISKFENPATVKDDFDKPKLANDWTFIRTPHTTWWSLTDRKGYLRIGLRPEKISELANPSFIGRRQEQPDNSIAARMEFYPRNENAEAGLVIIRDRDNYFTFTVVSKSGKNILQLNYRQSGKTEEQKIAETTVQKGIIFLKISSEGINYTFSYSADGTNWTPLNENTDGRFLGTAGSGRFTGTMVGMYASSNGTVDSDYVDYDWIEIKR